MPIVHDLHLGSLQLGRGPHQPTDLRKASGRPCACLLEAVSWVAGETWSERPDCVSHTLKALGIALNDALADDTRQQLVPLIPALVDTAADGLERRRADLATDWLIRTYLPTWLRLTPGLVDHAERLRQPHAPDELAATVWTAAAAASAAAGATARTGAAEGGRVALKATGSDGLAEALCGSPVRRALVWGALDACRDAAAAAATRAVWGVARNLPPDSTSLEVDRVAYDALVPTVDELQPSLIDLYTRMIHPAAPTTKAAA